MGKKAKTASRTSRRRQPAGAPVPASMAASRSRTPAPRSSGVRAKIRMYRQGLGDCFLITLPRLDTSKEPFRIMIDCGVILGTQDATTKMTNVVRDIAKETKGHIDILIATHLHWDHLSGFAQAEEEVKKLKIDQVWIPWTEDPKDPNGRELRDQQDKALTALQMSVARMNLMGASEAASEISGLLEFFGAAGASTGDALDIVRKLGPVRYCRPGEKVDQAETGVRIYIMGPPTDEKFLKKFNPSKAHPETFGFALDAVPATPALPGNVESPFGTIFAIPMQAARAMAFFQQRYWSGAADDQWRNIGGASFADASALALQLDRVTNNTSLAISIELENGDVLLFPADAQVGNWLSWELLRWNVNGREVKGHDLLRRTILYKVGHHGSHNATLREKGLHLMDNLQVAMVPVDHAMARKKGWDEMPLDDLMTALKQRAKTVVRIDEPPPSGVDAGPADLFYEVTL